MLCLATINSLCLVKVFILIINKKMNTDAFYNLAIVL